MKNKFYFLLFSFTTIWTALSGKIVETKYFNEILDYIEPETLVLLDIDDTLLIPTQTLGTDVWFNHRLKVHGANEDTYTQALDKALAEWEAVRHLTKVALVEEGTDKIVESIQRKNIVVMGLTTQGLALATRTINQLRSLNIDLSKTSPSKEDHYFINKNGVLYRQGILFTSGSPKGPALTKLLDIIDYHPKQIVFINDKTTHLQDVEEGVETRNIEFIGLRYAYSDQRVANFNKELADIQWAHSTFDHLLTDQEAEVLLNRTCPVH